MRTEKHELVVVGAGPAGLTSGIAAASYGVETLVIDRRSSTSSLPRSTVASTGTMELLRRWGLEAEIRKRSLEVIWRARACSSLAAAGEGESVEVGFPNPDQAALVSPTSPACLPQDELEPVLENHLRSHSSATLDRGVELVALTRDPEGGYLLTLAEPSGSLRRVRARFLIGADGLRSTVRGRLGIATEEGPEGMPSGLAIHFRAPLWELAGDHRHCIYFLTGEPQGRSLIPAGKPDRWIHGMHWNGPPRDVDSLGEEELKRWVREAAGDPAIAIELERVMPVTTGIGLAERFRDGDAFLVGDAAHRVTPRGGTGMNTAIRDGYDLGWKLAWVLRGWAGERLLDTYERERRPVAEYNTQRSARADGSILGTSFGLNADIGGRIPHVWVERAGGFASTLDLLGEGLTLLAGPDWNGSLPARRGAVPPVDVERLDAIAAHGLGLTPAGSMLVRPDGRGVALWNAEQPDPERLAHAIAAVGGTEVSLDRGLPVAEPAFA